MMERGAFLVLEGCDRVGKSTQVKRLVSALNHLGIPTEARGFPNRNTIIGGAINDFLLNKNDLTPETVHLLYSANRWECKNDLIKTLKSGTTLIVDRYAASGAAYSAVSTKKSLSWCMEPDRGLPAPDLVAYLKIDDKTLLSRGGWANERFEYQDFQKQVAENYIKLIDNNTWIVIEGDENEDIIHKELLTIALNVIGQMKNSPIKKLYENSL